MNVNSSSSSSSNSPPPTCLILGRPQRSKRTFVKWYVKEEFMLEIDNPLKPLLLGNDTAKILQSLDDCVVPIEAIIDPASLSSGGNTPSTLASSGTPSAAGGNSQAAAGGARGGENKDGVNIVAFQDFTAKATPHGGEKKTVGASLPDKIKFVPASACLTTAEMPSLDMNFVILPALNRREREWRIGGTNGGAGSSKDSDNNPVVNLDDTTDWINLSRVEIKGWSEAEENLMQLQEQDKLLNKSLNKGSQLVTDVLDSDLLNNKILNNKILNNKYVSGVQMGVNGLLSVTGAKDLIDLTKTHVKDGIMATGAHLKSNLNLLGAESMIELSSSDRSEMWRQLYTELVEVSQVILVFLEGADDVHSIVRELAEVLQKVESQDKTIHYFLPKWDRKSNSARETERSTLRTALLRLHSEFPWLSRSTDSEFLFPKPVGFETSVDSFMLDDLNDPEELFYKGQKVPETNRKPQEKKKYSMALCKKAAQEAKTLAVRQKQMHEGSDSGGGGQVNSNGETFAGMRQRKRSAVAVKVEKVGLENREKRKKEDEAKQKEQDKIAKQTQKARQPSRSDGWRNHWFSQIVFAKLAGLWWKILLGTILFLAVLAVLRRNVFPLMR